MLGPLERTLVLGATLVLTAWTGGFLAIRMDWPWALLATGYLGGFALVALAAFLSRHPDFEEE
ncbi:hypothetical protein DESUT3_39170 [Desulfuromonas versatilis]|uniref:Uncharacterized protein n=1 Tax=Desulfuromonas versatilis TaxID=2802975 RepID=A0ABM8I0J5_9BACT|nr:hypothetical protein [Desulfuromonas versatilis]BCR06848.1 hypothetical protein DESUT3_39170 [Desulfuromonas versatilis]